MTYDLDGNTLSDGTNSYAWDARNRLVSANNGVATFAYDPLGRRTAKTLLSATTGFLYDGPNAVQEQNGTGVTANMLTGGVDEHFQRTDGTGSYSYLTDALGSTVALTNSADNSVEQYSYGPYGLLSATGSNANSYTYTGRESDGLGIDYYRARYYNPTTGRFLSEDAIGFLGGINDYIYAADDPMDFGDPFGMDKTNSCIRRALGAGALSIGVDTLGFIPGEKDVQAAVKIGSRTFARQIGNLKGYRGIVADQVGARFIASQSQNVKDAASGYSIGNGAGTGDLLGTGLAVAGLIPGLNSGILQPPARIHGSLKTKARTSTKEKAKTVRTTGTSSGFRA